MAKTNIYIDGAQAGNTLKELKKEYNDVNRAIKEMKRDHEDYRDSVKKLGDLKAAMNKHQSDIKAVSQSYEQAGKTMKEMPAIQKQNASGWKSIASNALPFVGVAGLISVGIQGVTAAIGSWYRNNKEMEKSLSSLKSLTGASASDLEFYKEAAKEMGRTTTLSAIQAVEAFKLIGSARPDLLKDREALAQVTHEAVILAEAANMELAPAAQALASSMNQFNLGADQSKRIINTLAAGSVEGAAEIEDLTASIDRFGTVANANNVTIEESVALTELLSEKNLKGAEAGTQLRNVLLAMSTASALDAKAVQELEKFGVNVEMVMDKTVPFNERLQEMSKISGDQTALLRVFGKENIVVGQTLLQNVDHFEKLTTAVTGTNTAYVQAKINNDNLDGDLKKLSSAWEGLTLSTSAAQSPMRGIVQVGTEVLNWISDVIGLLTEWDELKFEEVLLDFGKALTYLNPMMFLFGDSLREAIDEQQRMNRLTQEVVDGMKAQADEAATLTMALDANNKALKDKNLTDIEAKKIQDENALIIDKLNTKYPELTKNYDLQNASGQQLSKLQKEITANLLDQSIAAVQATEAERLLAEMVQQSMAIAEQRATEQNRWGLTNFVADVFTDDAADLEEQLQKSQAQLENLPNTMKDVSARIKGLNLNFGQAFATQTQLMEESVRKINNLKVNAQLFKGSWMEDVFKGQMNSEEQILKVLKAQSEEEKKKYIENKKQEEQKAAAEKAAADASEKAKAKAEAARQEFENLKKTLDSIIESSSKFKIDFALEKRLAEFTDEFAKEMFVFENGIKSKYQKEIDSARELSKQKGKIGEDAAKELASLETLQAEELEFAKDNIRKKWRAKGEQEMEEYQANQTAQQLAQAESYEQALMDIKVARAYAAAQAVKDGDIKAQQEANEQLNAILIEQLEFEAGLKQKALDKQLKEGEINQAEFDARKLENETVLAEQISQIHTNTQEELMQMFEDRFSEIANNISRVVDTMEQIANAYFKVQLTNIENEKNQALKAEQERLDKGLISREQFELRKQELEDATNKKRLEIERQQAERVKMFAMFEAAINTAVSASKVLANPLLLALTLAAGAAQQLMIASEPLPQFIDGGFRNVVGANDGKTYNAQKVSPLKGGMTPNTPSYALFSESGPEYFVPNNLLKDVRVANMVNAIEAIRTNQQGAPGMINSIASGGMSDERIIALLNANLVAITALNQKIPNMGVKIGDKQIDDISTRSNELNSFKA
jgi:TP901 family phage tail tape measure protein